MSFTVALSGLDAEVSPCPSSSRCPGELQISAIVLVYYSDKSSVDFMPDLKALRTTMLTVSWQWVSVD